IIDKVELPIIRVQHHFAHMAAVIAEQHLSGDCLGLILDGYGYGLDSKAWGGELIRYQGSLQEFTSIGQLQAITLPGGDVAVKEPWRIALGLCHQLQLLPPQHLLRMPQAAELYALLHTIQAPTTSSCGRLFDGISALANICLIATYEAEAALRLEGLIKMPQVHYDSWYITPENKLDLSELIRYLAKLTNPQLIAELFVGTLAKALSEWVWLASKNLAIEQVILSGGCFQNSELLLRVHHYLCQYKLKVYVPQQLPFNDNSISLGQAFIANLHLD
ncbi:MAG: hypothetical protein ACK4M7_01710, partial [Burkholderiales bacterium]